MTTPGRAHHDVVVVGGRCAGAATALLLARAGCNVTVVDRATFPSDTLSTHGIARGGVVQLSRWGLLDDVLGTGAPAVREVVFGRDGEETRRALKDRAGVDLLVAPRRHVLDALLLDRARDAGAVVRQGVAVTDVLRDAEGRVAGVQARSRDGDLLELTAEVVVGADGLRSGIARQVGAPVVESFAADTAILYTYIGEVDWPAYEFHVAPEAFAGVFPTHGGEACVWLCRPTAALRGVLTAGARRPDAFLAALAEASPDLGARARAGRRTAPMRGTAGLPNHLRRPVGPGWALVGDAGYHRDPITGHGITDAFRDAELLAGAVARALRDPDTATEELDGYRVARGAALRETFDLTKALASFPAPDRFAELQIDLSEALDREAAQLASMPAPAGMAAAAA
jgi:2-polyprenyl-6-methoxyphenol hydroxylase-like FAD-dependent oxidoreductase